MIIRHAFGLSLLGLAFPLAAAASGQPDLTFGDDSALIIHADLAQPVGVEYASDLLIDSAGRYVTIGIAFGQNDKLFGLITRHFADGTPDLALGPKGVRHLQWADTTSFGHARQTDDGALIVIGWSRSDEPYVASPIVCRLRDNGMLDPQFQDGGCRRLDTIRGQPGLTYELNGLQLLSDGRILVLGRPVENPQDPRGFAIVRLLPNGDDDPSFGDNTSCDNPAPRCGIAYSPTQLQDAIEGEGGLAVDAQHRIVVAAHMNVGTFQLLIALRYSADGDLETTFSAMNFDALTEDLKTYHEAADIQIATDGSVMVVGMVDGPQSRDRVAVARWGSDGMPDPNFGNAGRVVHVFDDEHKLLSVGDSILQSDGKKLLIVGQNNGGFMYCQVLRLDAATGEVDAAFGNHGVTTSTTLNALSPQGCYARAVAADAQHIVVAGDSHSDIDGTYDANPFLLRLERDALFADSFDD